MTQLNTPLRVEKSLTGNVCIVDATNRRLTEYGTAILYEADYESLTALANRQAAAEKLAEHVGTAVAEMEKSGFRGDVAKSLIAGLLEAALAAYRSEVPHA
jgi:hypothetical protein